MINKNKFMRILAKDRYLTSSDMRVFLYLLSIVDESKVVFPETQESVGLELRMLPNNVTRSVGRLEELGYLKREFYRGRSSIFLNDIKVLENFFKKRW